MADTKAAAGAGALGLLFVLALEGGRRRTELAARAPAGSTPRPPARPPRAPDPVYAFIYQRWNETAVRMATGKSAATAREMGIFQTPAKAAEVAKANGWRLAWDGVREL